MRRLLPVALRAAMATIPTLQRRNFHFSEAEESLQRNQEARGFTSNVWVADEDLKYLEVAAKDGQAAAPFMVCTSADLYNADQLSAPLPDIPTEPMQGEYSYSSRKRYSAAIERDLASRRRVKNFNSNWWVTRGALNKLGIQPTGGNYPTTIVFTVKKNLYNADQLQDPESVTTVPLSAATRRAYPKDVRAKLQEHMKSNNFRSQLYLTPGQATKMGTVIVPNAEGVTLELRSGSGTFTVYNAEQTEHPSMIPRYAGMIMQ